MFDYSLVAHSTFGGRSAVLCGFGCAIFVSLHRTIIIVILLICLFLTIILYLVFEAPLGKHEGWSHLLPVCPTQITVCVKSPLVYFMTLS